MPRISWNYIKHIKMPNLDFIQKEIISQIEVLETEIAKLNLIIETSSEKKSKILEKHLK